VSKKLVLGARGGLITTKTPGLTTVDLDAAFADFLRLRVAEGDASPHTVRAYKQHVAAFVTWCTDEGIRPGQATEADLEGYRRYLVDAGYARSTIAVKLQAVERFYSACRWRGLRTDNPAKGLKAPRDKTAPEEKVKFLPLAGFQQLLATPSATSPGGRRDRAILALLGLHGLRIAEAAALDVVDLDLEGDPARLVVQAGKGGKARTIYLTERSTAILRDWLAMRDSLAAPGVTALFLALDKHTRGQAMTARSLRRRVDHYLEATGLKRAGVSAHSLRHTFATWAVFAGAPLPAVSADLGHASVSTTGIYARVADRIKQNPAGYLDKLLGSD
jgi:site-specific recombinase XerD